MNNNFLPETEYKEFEDRFYINPQIGVDETDAFIENLRQSQQANNQQVATQTRNLGTNVSSNLGGLIGGEGYWTSRYQTPQTNTAVSNLRATMQASALKEALANEQAMWKNRYQDAYRNYQKRQNVESNIPTATTPQNTTGNISQSDTTIEIADVSTEALADSRYRKLLTKYLQAGYPTDVAEKMAKEDFGKSVSVDATVEQYPYTRTKSAVGGESAYVYTLPNGNTVLVDESRYELVQPDYGGYALKNKQTGNLTQVGE